MNNNDERVEVVPVMPLKVQIFLYTKRVVPTMQHHSLPVPCGHHGRVFKLSKCDDDAVNGKSSFKELSLRQAIEKKHRENSTVRKSSQIGIFFCYFLSTLKCVDLVLYASFREGCNLSIYSIQREAWNTQSCRL